MEEQRRRGGVLAAGLAVAALGIAFKDGQRGGGSAPESGSGASPETAF